MMKIFVAIALCGAVFPSISLQVEVVIADGSMPLQCYWCGPSANQVHRSPRPPPCEGAGNHYVNCEEQYTSCATVYSAPPHMQSRICAKSDGEECYTEFCNTTRTWKITCPCKGKLCNVRDARREKEVFDILNRLVDKTFKNYRNKRDPYRPHGEQYQMTNGVFEDDRLLRTISQQTKRTRREVGITTNESQKPATSTCKKGGEHKKISLLDWMETRKEKIEPDSLEEAMTADDSMHDKEKHNQGKLAKGDNTEGKRTECEFTEDDEAKKHRKGIKKRLHNLNVVLAKKIGPALDSFRNRDLGEIPGFPWPILQDVSKEIESTINYAFQDEYPYDTDPYGLIPFIDLLENIILEGINTSDENYMRAQWETVSKELVRMAQKGRLNINRNRSMPMPISAESYMKSMSLNPAHNKPLIMSGSEEEQFSKQESAEKWPKHIIEIELEPTMSGPSELWSTIIYELTKPIPKEVEATVPIEVARTKCETMEHNIPIETVEATIPVDVATNEKEPKIKESSAMDMVPVPSTHVLPSKGPSVSPKFNSKENLNNIERNKNEAVKINVNLSAFLFCVFKFVVY